MTSLPDAELEVSIWAIKAIVGPSFVPGTYPTTVPNSLIYKFFTSSFSSSSFKCFAKTYWPTELACPSIGSYDVVSKELVEKIVESIK